MNREERAVSLFNGTFNCAQSVLSVFADVLEIDDQTLVKLASGFGGGMGRQQRTCGAVTGAYMVLGAIFSNITPDGWEQEAVYGVVNDVSERFRSEFGTVICRDLLDGADLKTEKGQNRFREEDLRTRVCARSIRRTVCMVEDILAQQGIGARRSG
ncbi:MAG: C-GCAxxG-C-C family protein [Spirochaetota bacterium]